MVASVLFLRCPRFSHPKLDSLIYLVARTLPMGVSWAMFFCQVVMDNCTLAGRAGSPLFICRDHSPRPLLGSRHGMGSLGFRCIVLTIFVGSGSRRKQQ